MKGDGSRGAVNGSGPSSSKVNAVVVDGEMSEDEKMEKFYALIKNYKEARERRRIELERASVEVHDDDVEIRRKRKRTAKSADRVVSSWIPAFKWEDFAENSQIKFQNSPVVFPTSFNRMHGGDRLLRRNDPPPPEVDGGGLDLRLRL